MLIYIIISEQNINTVRLNAFNVFQIRPIEMLNCTPFWWNYLVEFGQKSIKCVWCPFEAYASEEKKRKQNWTVDVQVHFGSNQISFENNNVSQT